MLVLLAQALYGVAALLVVGAFVELKAARRFSRLKKGALTDVESDHYAEITVEASEGVISAPLSRAATVLYTLVLVRVRKDGSGRQTLSFLEQRPFIVRDDSGFMRLDPKKKPIVVLGSEVTEKPLQFLPAGVLTHLVGAFGHLGHMWADDYVVTGKELAVKDGARFNALKDNGEVRMLFRDPPAAMAKAAAWRAAKSLATAAVFTAIALFVR